METIKITLEPETSFITPLQSDTLFGQFCWLYLYLYGKERLETLLKDFDENPFIVFSDGLPEGFLPMPKMVYSKEGEDVETYKKFKQFKKFKFVKKDLLLSAKTPDSLFKEFLSLSDKQPPENYFLVSPWKKQSFFRVSIDRFTGTAKKGLLFENQEFFTGYIDKVKGERFRVEIYARFNPDKISFDQIGEVFEAIGVVGFGAKRTWGKGKFKVVSIKKEEFKEPENSKTFISLSTGLPKEEEIEDFYAEFFTKYPKHPNDINSKSVFKAPIVLTKAGSVFKASERKKVYGMSFNISKKPEFSNFIHSAKILPLFLEFEPW